ncbi:MAG: nitrate- and nitrite sensing domain-containing protein, partial [Bdellovibrionota bacterium]
MKKLAFEWKVLIFGKLAFVPCLIGITWFLGHQYMEFIHARHNLTAGHELHQLSQLYREIVQERGTAMLFLRGRTSIFEFKDVVKKSDEVERRLNLQSHDSESLVSANMTALHSLREEIYTQGMTPDQTFSAYQNVLLQIQKALSLTIDLREATIATTSNLLFEDVASLRDLLIQQAIVNMPLSTQ